MKWNIDTEFEVNEYTFMDERIRRDVTFAVIADLHNCVYGSDNSRLMKAIEAMKPDFVIIAGDLIESAPNADGSSSMRLLKKLSERWRVFYGVGNHERKLFIRPDLRKQRDELVRGLQKAGVKLMHNSSYAFEDSGVMVTGLDIPHDYYRRVVHRNINALGLEKLLGKRQGTYYNVLIAHDPSHYGAYVGYGSDLVLSGHVHGGIIRIPGIGGLLSPAYTFFPKYDAGVYRTAATSMLVSRGIGSHTVNIRINNRPELLKVNLKQKKSGGTDGND